MSMPIITLTSPSQTTLSEISTNIHDASFSSYLDGAKENFIPKFASQSILNDHNIFLGKAKSDDKELDVFDAEKYFSEPNCSPALVAKNIATHHPKKDDPLEIFAIKEQQPSNRPTLSILPKSSWNSRSSLLHTLPKNRQQLQKEIKKGFFATISCNCSCADENSINVDDRTCDKQSNQSYKSNHLAEKFDEPEPKMNRFNFPVFNPDSVNHASKMKTQVEENIITQRSQSLQVFGSWNMCSDLEKKLTAVPWDSISPGILTEEIKIPSISSEMQNDMDSDASSGIFEIESFSKTNNIPFLLRQASDGCKSPATCYAPSEASIEWSVVTASAADYSVLSDCEELRPNSKERRINSKIGRLKGIPRLGTGILWGCKSHEAVRVDDDHTRRGIGSKPKVAR